MPTQKISVTVEARIAKALRGKVASRTLSQFVSRAIAHELERERLRAELELLEDELGPPDHGLVTEARAAFDRIEAAARPARAPRPARSRTRR